jgi:hypothetical protein
VEVPVIAAQVSVAPNAPAQCAIQIPPLPEGTRLFPRTIVHLFFLDFYEVASPFPVTSGATNTSTNQSPTSYEGDQFPAPSGQQTADAGSSTTGDDQDLNNARYKLLFGGEIVGFQLTKASQGSRSLVLQCLDWSNYWDYAYQWNNTDLFGPGVKAMFSGGSTNLFTDFLDPSESAILRIIQTPSVQFPNLKGLLGGIVHLIEAIGGSYYYGKTFAGENIFFSLAELRLHITQMVTAVEDDPTASRLLGGGYDSLFGRTLGNLGQQVSIRQAINALMALIFHETYAQPCPLYVPGSGNTPQGQTRQSASQGPYAFISTTANGLLQSITQVQGSLSAIDPNSSSAAAQQSLLASLASMRNTCSDTANRITDKSVLSARSFYASAGRSISQAQAKARSWQPGSNANVIAAITSSLKDASTQLQRAASYEVVSTTKTSVPARLNQQIFRPDVWFSAPPCCNVIFPELCSSVSYARQFLAEPTRLLLKTNDQFFGEDELFDSFYFAPKGFTLKSGGRELQNILSNDILPHELFTGILPVFEKMGELNIFGARSGTVNGKVPKIGLAQRSTNFLYFKYRFAARKIEIEGKFNPYVACGFPGLIIDKYVDPQTLALRQQLIDQNGGMASTEINQMLGAHILCNFTEVTHMVDQQTGKTQMNCGYARQFDEGTEFFGVTRPDQTVQQRADQDASRVTVVAAISPPTVGSLGPNLGKITAVQDVTQAYRSQDTSSGSQLPLYQGPNISGTTTPSINVPIGLSLPASRYNAAVVTLVGDPTVIVQFRAFRVTESVPRYSRTTVDLPAEEYIRPGWYGDVWRSSQIGTAYQKFFQTGAITDQQQVGLTSGGSGSTPSAASGQANAQAAQAVDADDPNANAPGLLTLATGASIEDAVAFIVETYSLVKTQNLDVDDYIRTYTWRPICTLVDLFGSSDLTLSADGRTVVQGIEGFHSRAFGPYSDLFGLTTPDIENIVGLRRGSVAAQKGDTRGRKRAAVQAYVDALQRARAILG